jgi:AbiV family abortive infection protein
MRKQQISKTIIEKSISACQENAQRLIEDAQTLEFEKPPASKYYLSIISQEESAKSFLLHLVKTEIIPWNEFILRAINNHVCKQLVGIAIDYLEPDLDTFLAWKGDPVTKKVKDALNLLRNEIIKKWESKNWVWADEYTYDAEAKKVFKGHFDESKQSALYVNLNKNAGVISTPDIITEEKAQEEFEKAKRFLSFSTTISNGEKNHFRGYEEIEEGFRMLFSDIN